MSIDANKKELLGEFKNGGSDYSPQGRPIEVNTHDFEDKELGKVVPLRGLRHWRQRWLRQPWNWRRLQWFTPAALKVVAATTRRRNRPDHSGLPLSAGHFQVEQDQASHVLLHHPELARHASRQPLRSNRVDRPHYDKKGTFRSAVTSILTFTSKA